MKVPEPFFGVLPRFVLSLAITGGLVLIASAHQAYATDNPKQESKTTAGDWPRFRGPNGTGISHAKTVPVKWDTDDYNWVIDLPGHGHGSPVIIGNRLYVVCGLSLIHISEPTRPY